MADVNGTTGTPVSRLAPFAPTAIAPRIIISTEGLEGSGKSDFALSAPKPLAYFVMDRGFEVTKDETKIRLRLDLVDEARYSYDKAEAGSTDPTTIAKACDEAAWAPFKRDLGLALTRGRAIRDARGRPTGQYEPYRSIVIDSASETWETCRLARFGKLEQVPPPLYTAVNAEFRGHVLRAAFKSDCNVIYVHKIKDEYVNKVNAQGKEIGVKTGKLVRAGFKEVDYQVPNMIRHTRDLTQPIPERYQIEVLKCANPEMEGLTLEGVDFALFAQMVYPDTMGTEYWE